MNISPFHPDRRDERTGRGFYVFRIENSNGEEYEAVKRLRYRLHQRWSQQQKNRLIVWVDQDDKEKWLKECKTFAFEEVPHESEVKKTRRNKVEGH